MTPEQTLLARIVANNDIRKLLELLLKHDGLAVGVELDQGELDVLRELKPVKPDVVYDLKGMEFDPEDRNLMTMFIWYKTPEGSNYWYVQSGNPTQEGRDKIAAMREQFEREKDMKLVFIATTAAIALGACAYEPPTCGLPNEPVVIGYAKDGNLIYDDQAPLSAPCPTVTPPNVSTPPVLPPVEPPVKGNNGWGNGDQDAPGGSEPNNSAENRGGNRNGQSRAPGKSWHD
jgi:hypothetical protein